MPFVALFKETGERIDITQVEYPKQKYKYGDCVCQLCEAPLRIRGGAYVRNHFAHDPSTPCNTDYSSQPESPHHREAKYFLLERLRKEFPLGRVRWCPTRNQCRRSSSRRCSIGK